MLKFEMKKFFLKMTTKVILTAFLLVIVILCFMAVDSVHYTDTDGNELTGISRAAAGRRLAADENKWKGELTPEKITEIAESYHELMQQYQGDYPAVEYGRTVQSYWEILYFASEMFTPDYIRALEDMDRVAEKDIAHIYGAYTDNLKNMAQEYGTTPEQEKFLEEQYGQIQIPVTYKAFDSWDTMATHAEMYILISVIVIGFLAAGIFDEEFRNHAELVFFTAKYGRSKAVINKIAAGVITTTIIYWAGIGILSLISFGIIGWSGFNTPYQITAPYSFYVITQGQRYFLTMVCGYIASLLSASVTMFITAKMHTLKAAVVIPFFMYHVLIFIGRPLSEVTSLSCFTPNVLIEIDRQLRHPHIFQIGNVVFRQVPFVMVLYAIVSIILLPFIFRSYSGYDSAKNLRRKS
ncbi:MAG: ABC transporter permease [Lachnospiraceae bacterium]|nr:ABC transporter permease [Lachnospiraceae bacterium]